MENNFDTVKLNNIERTRRLAKPALILTVLFLAAQCIRS
jgi:type IV secretory pathway component VirB8